MSSRIIQVEQIQSGNGGSTTVKNKLTYIEPYENDDFNDDDLINKRAAISLIGNSNVTIEKIVAVGTQLLADSSGNWYYEIPNGFGSPIVAKVYNSNGISLFVPDKIVNGDIYLYLPDIDDTGKTTQLYTIEISALSPAGGKSYQAKYKVVGTYAEMISQGAPEVLTSYKITADEKYLGATTTYDYYPDGDIMLTSSVKVN